MKIYFLIIWGIISIVVFFTFFDLIGSINGYLDSKKCRRIDISKKKIFIPYHGQHFFHKYYKKPHFDGTVLRITYILAILNYIHFIITILFFFLHFFVWKIWSLSLLLIWQSIYAIVVCGILGVSKKSFDKRLKKGDGLNFKI